MNREIDLTDWKPYRIGDLFNVVKGSRLRSLDRVEGEIPYVGASLFNNGYTHMISNDDHVHPGNVLTTAYNGTIPGKTFYQPLPFWATDDVNVLYPKFAMTVNSGLFIAPLIEIVGRKYVYVDKWKLQDMIDSLIFLPATPDGEPDCDYMEQTMRELVGRQQQQIDVYTAATEASTAPLHTGDWGEFQVGSLFEIKPTKAYKAVNAQLFVEDGINPVVVNSALNNGIGGYTQRPTTEAGGIITFSDTTSSEAIFYQPNAFVGYPHVQGMYPIGKYANDWNEGRLLFFLSVFKTAAVLRGFDYGDKFTRGLAASIAVRLPVTSAGDPDWDYMEQVMSEAMAEREVALNRLEALVAGA